VLSVEESEHAVRQVRATRLKSEAEERVEEERRGSEASQHELSEELTEGLHVLLCRQHGHQSLECTRGSRSPRCPPRSQQHLQRLHCALWLACTAKHEHREKEEREEESEEGRRGSALLQRVEGTTLDLVGLRVRLLPRRDAADARSLPPSALPPHIQRHGTLEHKYMSIERNIMRHDSERRGGGSGQLWRGRGRGRG